LTYTFCVGQIPNTRRLTKAIFVAAVLSVTGIPVSIPNIRVTVGGIPPSVKNQSPQYWGYLMMGVRRWRIPDAGSELQIRNTVTQ